MNDTVTVETKDGCFFHIPKEEYLKMRAVVEHVLEERETEIDEEKETDF